MEFDNIEIDSNNEFHQFICDRVDCGMKPSDFDYSPNLKKAVEIEIKRRNMNDIEQLLKGISVSSILNILDVIGFPKRVGGVQKNTETDETILEWMRLVYIQLSFDETVRIKNAIISLFLGE